MAKAFPVTSSRIGGSFLLAMSLFLAASWEARANTAVAESPAAHGIWTQLNLASPPWPSYSGSLAYDSRRHRAILHHNQLYTLDLDNPVAWIQLPATGMIPTARTHALVVYDSLEDRVVLHGGLFNTNSTTETYFLDFDDTAGTSGTWQHVAPEGPPGVGYPAPRHGHGGIYDPVRQELIFYGGYSSGCGYSVSVWALSLNSTPTWRNPSTAGFGGGVFESVCGYDASRRQIVVYGGFYHLVCGGQWVVDSWANTLAGFPLDGGSWVPQWPNATGPVNHERGAVGACDPSRDRILTMPNVKYPDSDQDSTVVAFSRATAQWDTLSPAGVGPGGATAMLYDPIGDRMLVGRNASTTTWWFLTFPSTAAVSSPDPNRRPRLFAPHPNPVRDHAVVRLELSKAGPIDLSVLDVQGRLITLLFRGDRDAGGHDITWNARDASGVRVAGGIYFVRLTTTDGIQSTRVVVAN